MDPNDPQILMVFARVLAAIDDPAYRNGPEALRLATRANELTGGNQYLIMDTMAMAYAEVSRFDEAQKFALLAIELGKAVGPEEETREIEERLKLYAAGKPYRQSSSGNY
jgi:hypothetical protein